MAALQLEKRRPTAATSEEWPVGMRVMAVDDDRVCLKILEVTLQMYKYNGEKFFQMPLEYRSPTFFFH